jgi:hypothetical protein
MEIVLEIYPARLFYVLVTGCAVSPTAHADSPAARTHGPVTHATSPIFVPIENNPTFENNPNFAGMRAQLQTVANTAGFHTTNHFCVVAYGSSATDPYPQAYIYWPTQNKIIRWDPGSNQPILESGRFFDLTRDVLPDGAVTNGYFHKSEMIEIIQDWQNHGTVYTIKKTAGGWVPISQYPQFASVRTQLQYIADNNITVDPPRLPKTGKFCVIGQKDGTLLGAYVYWQTEQQLIFWLPGQYNIVDPFAVAVSVVEIDLKHGLRDEEDAKDNSPSKAISSTHPACRPPVPPRSTRASPPPLSHPQIPATLPYRIEREGPSS